MGGRKTHRQMEVWIDGQVDGWMDRWEGDKEGGGRKEGRDGGREKVSRSKTFKVPFLPHSNQRQLSPVQLQGRRRADSMSQCWW